MKYYKCKLCGFEFYRVGAVEKCVMCEKSAGLLPMNMAEQAKFIDRHTKSKNK